MTINRKSQASYTDFLNVEGRGRKLIHLNATNNFFSQGTKSNYDVVLHDQFGGHNSERPLL
jgi:hypothetical protein